MKNSLLFILLAIFSCKAVDSSDTKVHMLNGLMVKEISEKEIIGENGEMVKAPEMKPGQSTFFLVRHAEKASGEDPVLTAEGKARAERLAAILKKRPIKQVFSTNYQRTQLTAAPTAGEQAAMMGSYNPDSQEAMINQLLKQGGGYNYLIVGHSNTIPGLLNLFAGNSVYEFIHEKEYDNLYMVIASDLGKARIFELKY